MERECDAHSIAASAIDRPHLLIVELIHVMRTRAEQTRVLGVAREAGSGLRQIDDVQDAGLLHRPSEPVRKRFAGVRAGLEADPRSEERRVGKECRSRWSPYH